MNIRVHTPTPKLATSVDFYRRLGFSSSSNVPAPGAPAHMVAGDLVVEINPDRFARAGLRLTKPDWSKEVSELERMTGVVPMGSTHLVVDPSGVWIYLTEGEVLDVAPPAGKSLLGNFSGLSLETASFTASMELWRILGFNIETEGPEGIEDRSWLTGSSPSGFPVSWMRPGTCPHLFFNPSLTFFNSGRNLEAIAGIVEAGIEITEEITGFNDEGIVDNVIVRDPGGYGFFVFND